MLCIDARVPLAQRMCGHGQQHMYVARGLEFLMNYDTDENVR